MFYVHVIMGKFIYPSNWQSFNYIWNCYAYFWSFFSFFSDKMKWFGNLHLNFSYKSDSTRFYAPIGSMMLLSAILSIFANIFFRFFK